MKTLPIILAIGLLGTTLGAGKPESQPASPETGSLVMEKLSIEQLTAHAEQGNADAQCELAKRYGNGEGVNVDLKQALRWFQKAAEQKHPRALGAMGMAYLEGRGIPQDTQKAINHIQQAADLGDSKSQVLLASCYAAGRGVPQDMAKAEQMAAQIAAHGTPSAKYDLAI